MAVHAWLTLVGTVLIPGEAFWDVDLYRWWMWLGLHAGTWPVLDGTWVYPAGALVPMLLPGLVDTVGTRGYALAWCAMLTVLDGLAIALLTRTARDRDRPLVGAWWWLAFLAALGPVAMGRLDAVVAPVVVVALTIALRRPNVAATLLTIGAWIKVAPGALLLPLVMVVRRPWRTVVGPAGTVCLVVAALVAGGGGPANLASFLLTQGERGLQLESVGATPWMIAGLVSPDIHRYLNQEITTWEVSGPGTAAMATFLGVALVLGLAAAAALLLRVRRAAGTGLDATAFLMHGALLVTTVLIVANKVGSPQFIGWLAAPVVVGLTVTGTSPGPGRRAWLLPSLLVLVIAGLTQVVFPVTYSAITAGWVGPTLVLVLRNVLLVVLLVVTARTVWRLRVGTAAEPADAPLPAEPDPSA